MSVSQTLLQSEPGNVIVSPISVYCILAQTQQGARGQIQTLLRTTLRADAEKTRNECQNFIHSIIYRGEENFTVEADNGIFLRNGCDVLPNFETCMTDYFMTEFIYIDFTTVEEAKEAVNTYVIKNNKQNITQLISVDETENRSAILAVLSAFYFEANWSNTFVPIKIKSEEFRPGPDLVYNVPTMFYEQTHMAGTSTELGAKWVHLNMQVTTFTMLLVLPIIKYGLKDVIQRLTPEILTELFSEKNEHLVRLSLPKFKIQKETDLIPVLKNLGLQHIFEDNADFSGIISELIANTSFSQNMKMDVDERGISVLTDKGSTKCQPAPKRSQREKQNAIDFTADHPFLVFIVDRINSVPVFAGRVTKPRE
ncbi:alpha-1-antitrypsin-like protein GS55-MS [Periplaneta americana]|uniref:alpha-1-antitrypsin-like protein GS55-MS n=1 Tax=Periplaneta americana TaxID=6978 RepID=UPI0037E809A7